jgi:putative spermidine/putrescine transport system ATP-binding protein
VTRFVAGFVGTSNLLTGDVAMAILGRSGTFTIRPEKIHLREPDAAVGAEETGAAGVVQDVVYVGPDTRYIVQLEAGARLVVTQQNLATSSTEALAQQGKAVRLVWKRQHELPIADGAD